MRGKVSLAAVMAAVCLALFLVNSCTTNRDIAYVQDLQRGSLEHVQHVIDITVKPEDKIAIIVKSKDPQLSELFNLPIVTYRIGQGKTTSLSNQNQQVATYSVASDGTIDFPVLGKLDVAGKRREEIAAMVKGRLVSEDLVKDPVVMVEFDNLCYAVLGEVNKPGQFSIDRDKVSILDAISKAGDLTIYGKRNAITVLRWEGDEQKTYKIDLTSGHDLYTSPAFYLQQNDIVYVEPNATRSRQSTVNGNNVRSTSFWVSIASLLTTIAVLVFK